MHLQGFFSLDDDPSFFSLSVIVGSVLKIIWCVSHRRPFSQKLYAGVAGHHRISFPSINITATKPGARVAFAAGVALATALMFAEPHAANHKHFLLSLKRLVTLFQRVSEFIVKTEKFPVDLSCVEKISSLSSSRVEPISPAETLSLDPSPSLRGVELCSKGIHQHQLLGGSVW